MGSALKRIIEQHGGRIWVESSVGQDATFFLTLKPAALSLAGAGTFN
jgi:signal transduction histidine kinase